MLINKWKYKTVLTEKHEVAINLIATGSTLEETALVLNISSSTIGKWKRENALFAEKLKEITDHLKMTS
jgi:DNA-binding CsgD family transcriptional regulator